MAIALAILGRALSKRLAPLGATVSIEVVQTHLHSLSDLKDDASAAALTELQKGDRLDLTVQHHAKLASVSSDAQAKEMSSLGYVLARRNECLVVFPTHSQKQPQDQSRVAYQIRGYHTTTVAAYVAALYYDLRGGVLLLGYETDAPSVTEHEDSSRSGNKTLQSTQALPPSLIYILLDSRWCTWLKVYEGMAIASEPIQ